MRYALPLLALAFGFPAQAGGFGLITTAGVTQQPVHFYDSSRNYAQYRQVQTLPMFGTGIEAVLGARNNRVVGVFRGYWLLESAERDPATRTQAVSPDNVVAAWRDEPRHIGMASMGMQWGILGSPDTFQLTAVTALGSGFLTTDKTEFLFGQFGAGATYQLDRTLQAHADLSWMPRYRKGLSQGFGLHAGVRYLFD